MRIYRRTSWILAGMFGLYLLAGMPASVAQPPSTADPKSYLADVVGELEKSWPDNRTVNIVAHGHSVPAGYFKTPLVDSFNAYPLLLHRWLGAAFPHAVINVIVTAIGGEDSTGGARRFERDVLALRPDVVLIDYGLNDRGIGLEKARRAWSQMIEEAKAHAVKVILLTPTADTGANLDDPNDPLNQHAAQIRELAASYHVALADSLAAVRAYVAGGGQLAELMSQVNHPNRKGHDLVVDELQRWFAIPAGKTEGLPGASH
jgi:lysophospholipase L1-like esterase